MKKILIVGHGYVGRAMENLLKDHYETHIYDPALAKTDKRSANKCDLAVICVPTPMDENRDVDISIVEEIIKWLRVPLILIKSTIPPGTTNYLRRKYKKRICFSPEYIGEGKYFVPFWKYPHPTEVKYHNFMIIGGKKDDCSEIFDFFKEVMGPDVRYIITDSKTAELTKYMENSWGGMKVTFCNEFFEIAKAFNVNYDELRELFLLDGRTERMHTAVFRNKRGFSGKCFPKDINGIIRAAEKAGYDPRLLKQILKSNDIFCEYNKKIKKKKKS